MIEPKKMFILNTLVGSHAHGLAEEGADKDYRGVYVIPTKELLSLNFDGKKVLWEEGERDQTGYELSHFLTLASNNVPNALEILVAPVVSFGDGPDVRIDRKQYGQQLRELFDTFYHPDLAYTAFTNYANNNKKKMVEDHLQREFKYAALYIRTLLNLNTLLREGTFSLEVNDYAFKIKLLQIKRGETSVGKVLDYGRELEYDALAKLRMHSDDLGLVKLKRLAKVNKLLLEVRKEFWDV